MVAKVGKIGSLVTAFIMLAMLVVALLPQPAYGSPDPSWWDADWQYRKKLTFLQDPGQSGALTDFPVMVEITSSDTNFWSHVRDDGFDVRFLDSDDSTQCDFHFEKFDHVADVMTAWVEVPSIAAYGTTDYIWLYYGNPSASADPQNESGTYDANFKMVQHLEETSGTHYDSTANNNDGTPQGGVTQDAMGKISGADDFDGTDDYVEVPDDDSLDIAAAVTIEAWINSPDFKNQYPGIACKWDWSSTDPQRSYSLHLATYKKPFFMISADGTYQGELLSATELATDTWYYLTGVSTGSKWMLYINGELDCERDFVTTIHSGTAKFSIGASMKDGSVASDETFKGTIDEVRISNTTRSANWIKAQYLSMTDAFITFGSEETNQPPTVDAVALYESDESTLINPGGAMDPQVEYAVKVTVTDADTLDDVNEVKVAIFYDSAGTDPTAPGIGDTQTCAIITWTKGGSPAWTIDPSASTTWVLVTASCKVPSDMGQTTGDWWAHFKPGKVATESGAADDWDIHAKATDAAAGSGELYARDYEMNWYGEITVNTASVDWGTVALGSDFAANEQTGISITYIANGAYNQQVKASNPWGTAPDQVTLNEGGNPGPGEFSLKAGNGGTPFYDDFEEHNVGDTPDGWSLSLGSGSGTLSVQEEATNKVMDYTHVVDGDPHITAGHTSWTDYTYEAKMRIVTGNSHHGLLFRSGDRNNTCYCGVSDPTNGIVQLWKRIGGTWTQIGGDWSITPPGNTWHDWKVVVNGTNIKVYWDGAYLGEGDLGSGELTSGKIGCFAGYEGQTRYDDFKVHSSKVLVLTADYTTFDTSTQTGESGNTESSNTLWLKLGPSGIPAVTYSGTIYYGIAQ